MSTVAEEEMGRLPEEVMEQEVLKLEASGLVSGKPRQLPTPEKTTMLPPLRGCAKKWPPSKKQGPVPLRPLQAPAAASQSTFWMRSWTKTKACTALPLKCQKR